ncbi:MAG: hypothetical protein HZT43_10895 [Exiguobacterium profundum]|nr:MAG: hypothetical protein HZT43_10895 [Exiguobacterium profundum]
MMVLFGFLTQTDTSFTYLNTDGDLVTVTGADFTYDPLSGALLTGTVATMALRHTDGTVTTTTIRGMATAVADLDTAYGAGLWLESATFTSIHDLVTDTVMTRVGAGFYEIFGGTLDDRLQGNTIANLIEGAPGTTPCWGLWQRHDVWPGWRRRASGRRRPRLAGWRGGRRLRERRFRQ